MKKRELAEQIDTLRGEVAMLRAEVATLRLPRSIQTVFPTTGTDWGGQITRNADYAERCPCNPANGGSGICGCVLGGPQVTC